jgi:aminoglycoside 3-N-acetyltransferase I
MKQNAKTFEIKRLTKEDLSSFESLINLFNVVFEEEEPTIGSKANLEKLLGNSGFIALTAVSENEIVGGLTAYILPLYYSEPSEVFLYDMAVKSEFQRMGIGKGLLQRLKEYCVINGIREFFVMAHEEDEFAVDFYHSTGGKGEKVMNFVYETFG